LYVRLETAVGTYIYQLVFYTNDWMLFLTSPMTFMFTRQTL